MSGLFESVANVVSTVFRSVFCCVTQKIPEKAIVAYPWTLILLIFDQLRPMRFLKEQFMVIYGH